jgi:hypothetical protein
MQLQIYCIRFWWLQYSSSDFGHAGTIAYFYSIPVEDFMECRRVRKVGVGEVQNLYRYSL